MRCFLAIELSADVREQLGQLQKRLRALDRAVRWTRPDQIHLTLKFLGDVPDADVSSMCDAAAEVARRFPPFELRISGTGCFPPGGPARIVWVGIDGPPQPLVECHRACEETYARLGFEPEGRAYTPHLTVGRVRDGHAPGEIRAAVQAEAQFSLGSVAVAELVMFQSVLGPTGPTHTAIRRAPLGVSGG